MPRPKKKWQTRLTFSPLPSSSPAAAEYPEQLQGGAAAIGYDSPGRPIKKRRVDNDLPNPAMLSPVSSSPVPGFTQRSITGVMSSSNEVALPTPVASSQVDNMEKHGNLTIIDDAESRSGDEKSDVLPRRLFQSRKKASFDTDDDSSDTSPSAQPASVKISARHNRTGGVAPADPQAISGTAGSTEPGKGDTSLKLGLSDEDRLRTVVISSSEDESDHLERVAQAFSAQPSSPTATTPPHSRPMSSRLARRRRVVSSPTSETDSDANLCSRQLKTPTKTGRSRKQLTPSQCLATRDIKRSEQSTDKRSVRSSTMSQRQKEVSRNSHEALESSESSSDNVRLTVQRKGPIAASRLSDSDDSDQIAHIECGSRSHKSLRKPAPVLVSSDGHASSEEIVTPSRKRRLARAGAAPDLPNVRPEGASDRIVDDLQEDVEDLKETKLRDHRTRATNRTPKKTKAQQQLELLKLRRASRNVVDLSSGSEDDLVQSPTRRRRAINEDTDSREDETRIESEHIEDNNPPFALDDEDLDQYDEDFVVEDEDEPLGGPHSLSEIPLEFTRHAHKKPIEHFKDAVEWMVHNRLNPAFPRNDPIYQVAVQKLDDEVRGLAGSKFMSAAWNANFLSTLKAKPDIAYLDAAGLFEQHCEACNRSNHPAKFQLIFSGKPYNRQSLEEISDDEEEDGTESQGGRFGRDEKSFYVGRTCCANAETSHALHHWRYALNQWVLEWLTRRGHTTAGKIVERERWSTKKRTQYANDVVDGMEASGEVRVLYKEFKENLHAARDARPDTYTYGRKR